MTSPVHADLEAISAYLDGEAPEWADHVSACAECRATAAGLRAVAAAVATPVDPPSAADRERAIAAALDVAGAGLTAQEAADRVAPQQPVATSHDAHRARFARRRPLGPWAMPAVAAVVLLLVGLSGVVLTSYRSTDESTTLAGPPAADPKADVRSESSGGGVAAAAPAIPPSDLGDLPDAATLRARAQGAVSAGASTGGTGGAPPSTASASAPARSGAAADAGAMTPTTTLTQRAAPSVVGTRPCEEQARTREPALGPVVYFATARQGQVAGFVLGFGATGTSTSPVTLLLLAQDGCRELLRASGP